MNVFAEDASGLRDRFDLEPAEWLRAGIVEVVKVIQDEITGKRDLPDWDYAGSSQRDGEERCDGNSDQYQP